MSRDREGGRRVVASGAIRVDATRAVEGLRRHLLLDLATYLHEIVRAGVAGGATGVDLDHDADDVVVAFDGAPVAASALARLLDHVLADARGPEERRLWLLALGVNAALGLDPAFVDVTSWGHEDHGGEAVTARFTAAAHERADAGTPALSRGAPPPGAGRSGVRVHVRRKVGWEVLKRAALGGWPAEVRAVAEATNDLAIPTRLGGAPIPRAARPADLVRVAFDVPGARAASLVVTGPSGAPPTIDLAEHGVRLVRYAFAPPAGFPVAMHGGLALPIRVVVDAPALPTNASRSALREDAALFRAAIEGAAEALPLAVGALVDLVAGRAPSSREVTVLPAGEGHALEEALGAMIAVVAGAARRGEPLAPEARTLLALPLLRDGAGRPKALTELAGGVGAPIWAWRGAAPPDAELGPWLGDVVWLRGRTIERALDGLALADASSLVERAAAGLARRKALHAHPAGPPRLPASADHLARDAFRVTEGPLMGLEGEVAIARSGLGLRGAVVRVFVEGRQLGAHALDARTCPLPVDAAIAWEGRLRPRFEYDGVADDAALRDALAATLHAAVRLASRLAGEVKGELEAARLAPLFAAAVRTAYAEPGAPGATIGAPGLPPGDPLRRARVLRATEPGRWLGLDELEAALGPGRALLAAGPRATGVSVTGRPVVAVEASERGVLARALGEGTIVVDYERALFGPKELAARERSRTSALRRAIDALEPAGPAPAEEALPRLAFSREGARGLVSVAAAPRLVHLHAGVSLGETPFASWLGPVALAVDDDRSVPDATWTGVLATTSAFAIDEVEEELCAAIVRGLSGEGARLPGLPADAASAGPILRAYLLRSARGLADDLYASAAAEGAAVTARRALHARIEALPVLVELDERGAPRPVSMAEARARRPEGAAVPVVLEPTGFATVDWRPLVASVGGRVIVDVDAIRAWAGDRVEVASADELATRRAAAARGAALRALRSRPVEGARAFPAGEAREGAIVVDRTTAEGEVVAATLPALARTSTRVTALFEGRPVDDGTSDVAGPPVVVRVDLRDESLLGPRGELTSAGAARARALAAEGASMLALAIVQAAVGPGRSARLLGDEGALAAVLGALRTAGRAMADLDRSLDAHEILATLDAMLSGKSGDATSAIAQALTAPSMLWPTVQGDEQPINALLVAEGAIVFGRDRHVGWIGPAGAPARLDAPVLYLPATPNGAAARALLEGAGRGLRDETAAIAELAARRAAGRPREAPRLAGAPAHPALRATLASLDVFSMDGEIEIVPGPSSDVTLTDLDGTAREVRANLPFSLRAVARVDAAPSRSVDTDTCKDLARAGVRLLRAVTTGDADVPAFARDHQRALLCRTLQRRGRLAKLDQRARVLADTAGGWHALADLVARSEARAGAPCPFTTDGPPFPARAYDPPVLRLAADEAKAIEKALPLRDDTSALRRDREAEGRAAAPPVARLGLDPGQRAACVRVVRVDEPDLVGEVGLLHPAEANRRGLSLHVGRRPLCVKGDGVGWPLLGVLDAPSLEPNRAFDGPRRPRDLEAIRERVRAAVRREVEAWLAPPPGALASRVVEETLDAGGGATLVLGALWLPRAWPAAPRVRMLAPGLAREGEAVPLRLASAPRGHEGSIPIEGALLVLPPTARKGTRALTDPVGELGLGVAVALVDDVAARGGSSADVIEAYRWDLGLLGVEVDASAAASPAPTTEAGRAVTPAEVVAELGARRAIWAAREGGSTDGDFPEGTPAFFLRDAGGVALAVLAARLEAKAFRRLGEPAVVDVQDVAAGAEPAPDPSPPSAREAPAEAAPPTSWLAGLVQSAIALVVPKAPPETAAARGVRAAVAAEIARLALSGDAVAGVELATSGRAVRYDASRRMVVLNRRHAAVAPLLAAAPARAVPVLAAAAVAEVNRALVEVTDAEEVRALGALLAGVGPEAPRGR